MTKTKSVRELLEKEMENPVFKKAYDSFAYEFTLAQEVIDLRLKAELTQAELARRAHTSQPAISRLESGNYKNVSLAFLRKIGQALNAAPVIHFKTS